MPRRKEPHIPDAILDQLLAGADPKTAFDPNGLLDGLKKALAERALNAEMDHHLAREETGNSRNGYGHKTVVTDTGKLDLQIPRDRQASFDPQLIRQVSAPLSGFRREGDLDVCARHEHARDRRAPARAVWRRGFARPDQRRHGRGLGRDRGLASPPARAGLSPDLL